jgi:3-isopropylmalate dehydrogenase
MTDTAAAARPTIAVIGGDGIGPEVVAEGLKVLDAAVGADAFEFVHYDLGAERWQRTGEVLPDSVLRAQAGVTPSSSAPSARRPAARRSRRGLLERGLLLKLRFAFDHYVNLRPSKLYPGVATPLSDAIVARGPIDFVVVREGTEGLYAATAARCARAPRTRWPPRSRSTPPAAWSASCATPSSAPARRKQVTLVHKHNVLVNAGGLWNRIFTEVAAEYPR